MKASKLRMTLAMFAVALVAVGCGKKAEAATLTIDERVTNLETAATSHDERIRGLDAFMSKVETDQARGTAMALAHTAIPFQTDAPNFSAGTGIGVFQGQAAIAAGMAIRIDSTKNFRGSFAITEGGETSASMGFAAKF